jgi:predicted acetyltransferase
LGPEDESEARLAQRELAVDGFVFLLGWEPELPWGAYLSQLADARFEGKLKPGWVPATFLVAEVDGLLVGRVSIRHRLNAALRDVGGHIGYGVRPAYRGRGFATEMLRQAVTKTRELGVDRILDTCDEDNLASIRTIERNGGQLQDVRPFSAGTCKRRYWID